MFNYESQSSIFKHTFKHHLVSEIETVLAIVINPLSGLSFSLKMHMWAISTGIIYIKSDFTIFRNKNLVTKLVCLDGYLPRTEILSCVI